MQNILQFLKGGRAGGDPPAGSKIVECSALFNYDIRLLGDRCHSDIMTSASRGTDVILTITARGVDVNFHLII